MKTLAFTLAFCCLAAVATAADQPCSTPEACTQVQTCGSPDHCGRCGRSGSCEKYCKVVCETKEVKKHVWVVKCSEFCTTLPGCGRTGCDACDSCNACAAEADCGKDCSGKCDPCAVEKNKCIVPPHCGTIRVKKTLEKKEIVCKVPTYKCIVVYACSNCGPQQCDPQPEAAPLPSKTTLDVPAPPVIGTSYSAESTTRSW
jgi:hypothetical protein